MNYENQVFSKQVSAGKRTYFFNVKVAKNGNKYLIIKESKFTDNPEEREKTTVMVFDNAFNDFAKAFDEVKDKVVS